MVQAYSVLAVSSTDKGADFIKSVLQDGKYENITYAKNAGEARRLLIVRSYDLVIINSPLTDENGYELAINICQNTQACVMLLVKADIFEQAVYETEQFGVFTVSKPVSKPYMYQSLSLMCATRERLKKLEEKNDSLEEKMAEIRVVNRAKWLLIDILKMSESQAHKYIEKKAMDMRISKRLAAESIIRTYDI